MKPIQGVQYSAIVRRNGFIPMVQCYVIWDGFAFRNDQTKAIEKPLYLQIINEYGAKRHAHEDAFEKAMDK